MITMNPLVVGLARRLGRTFAAVTVCCITVVPPAIAQDETGARYELLTRESAARHLTVPLGQAEVLRYSYEPGTIIIGDPGIAAVSVAASDILVVTGLQPGETNVIILDDDGAQIDRIALRVIARGDTVVVRRGLARETLRCDPLCAPTDAQGFTPAASELPEASEPRPPGAVDTTTQPDA